MYLRNGSLGGWLVNQCAWGQLMEERGMIVLENIIHMQSKRDIATQLHTKDVRSWRRRPYVGAGIGAVAILIDCWLECILPLCFTWTVCSCLSLFFLFFFFQNQIKNAILVKFLPSKTTIPAAQNPSPTPKKNKLFDQSRVVHFSVNKIFDCTFL